jgi:hypothetical protein
MQIWKYANVPMKGAGSFPKQNSSLNKVVMM